MSPPHARTHTPAPLFADAHASWTTAVGNVVMSAFTGEPWPKQEDSADPLLAKKTDAPTAHEHPEMR